MEKKGKEEIRKEIPRVLSFTVGGNSFAAAAVARNISWFLFYCRHPNMYHLSLSVKSIES